MCLESFRMLLFSPRDCWDLIDSLDQWFLCFSVPKNDSPMLYAQNQAHYPLCAISGIFFTAKGLSFEPS